MRDLTTGEETQLTTAGVKDFGYATNNAGWTKSNRPVLLWSPDSKKIATFQHDGRRVGEMYLVTTNVGHPTLHAWKYPLPEDSVIFRIHRVVIHLDGPRVVRLQMPPDQHRSTICDHIVCRGAGFSDIEWSPDASQLAFISTSRDHKHEVLRIADPETGAVRDVMEETVETFFESGFNKVNWHVLSESNEVIWFSQRDDWGEKWQGLLKTNPDGTTNYDNQANQLLAGNVKGKLLLAHGNMDSNVPMYNTLLVVNELIAANKDFDLILFPNRGHGFGNEPYMMRRRWDYFVKHLMGAEPPKEYEFQVDTAQRRRPM